MGQACTTEDESGQRTEVKGLGWTRSRSIGFRHRLIQNVDDDEAPSTHSVAMERSDINVVEADQVINVGAQSSSSWPVISVDIIYREHMALLKEAGLEMCSWEGEASGTTADLDVLQRQSEDTLLVVDMQNDFIPGKFAPCGGRAAVPEGEAVVDPVTQLIEAFSKRGALIVATRAFHPADHSSFYEQGGPLPSHCVQTTPGSFFCAGVAEALHRAYTAPLLEPGEHGLPGRAGRVEIAFKGFLEEVSSSGAFRYNRDLFEQRLKHSRWDLQTSQLHFVTCAEKWTGACALKCSNLPNDINCNPDLSALLQQNLRPLDEVVPRTGRLLIVGLAFDTSVLDSAVAASRLGYERVFVAIDACRPTYFGMSGEYGSGFATDPAYIVAQLQKHNIGIVQFNQVLRSCGSPKLRKGNSPGRGGA